MSLASQLSTASPSPTPTILSEQVSCRTQQLQDDLHIKPNSAPSTEAGEQFPSVNEVKEAATVDDETGAYQVSTEETLGSACEHTPHFLCYSPSVTEPSHQKAHAKRNVKNVRAKSNKVKNTKVAKAFETAQFCIRNLEGHRVRCDVELGIPLREVIQEYKHACGIVAKVVLSSENQDLDLRQHRIRDVSIIAVVNPALLLTRFWKLQMIHGKVIDILELYEHD